MDGHRTRRLADEPSHAHPMLKLQNRSAGWNPDAAQARRASATHGLEVLVEFGLTVLEHFFPFQIPAPRCAATVPCRTLLRRVPLFGRIRNLRELEKVPTNLCQNPKP